MPIRPVNILTGTFVRNDSAGYPDHNRIVGNVFRDDAIRTHGDIIADSYGPYDFCTRTDENTVAQNRGPFVRPSVDLPDGAPLRDIDVRADYRFFGDIDRPAMYDEEAPQFLSRTVCVWRIDIGSGAT